MQRAGGGRGQRGLQPVRLGPAGRQRLDQAGRQRIERAALVGDDAGDRLNRIMGALGSGDQRKQLGLDGLVPRELAHQGQT